MVKKYVMLADTVRCIDCKACVVACRAEWDTPLGYSRDWVKQIEQMDAQDQPQVLLFPGRCQHCDDPPCVHACPSGASYKREDNIVLVDEAICSGCELCVPACPYDARWLNPVSNTISKCTFCQPRIDQGLAPACVQTCVGHALIFGDVNDPQSEVSHLLADNTWTRLTTSEVDIGPNHYYRVPNAELPTEVLPKPHAHHVSGQVMEKLVNPIGFIGMGGMFLTFLAAGVMKVIGRRQAQQEETHHEDR